MITQLLIVYILAFTNACDAECQQPNKELAFCQIAEISCCDRFVWRENRICRTNDALIIGVFQTTLKGAKAYDKIINSNEF